MRIRVCLLATVLIHIVLFYALYCKGDVKAAFKFFGVEFSLETKDKTTEPKHLTPPAENSSEARGRSAEKAAAIVRLDHQ